MKNHAKPAGFRTVFTGSAGIDVTTRPDTSFVTATGHFQLLRTVVMDRLRDELSHYFEPTRFASTSKMKPSHQRINVGPSPRVRATKNPPGP